MVRHGNLSKDEHAKPRCCSLAEIIATRLSAVNAVSECLLLHLQAIDGGIPHLRRLLRPVKNRGVEFDVLMVHMWRCCMGESRGRLMSVA